MNHSRHLCHHNNIYYYIQYIEPSLITTNQVLQTGQNDFGFLRIVQVHQLYHIRFLSFLFVVYF